MPGATAATPADATAGESSGEATTGSDAPETEGGGSGKKGFFRRIFKQ